MAWCEERGIDYNFGLSGNRALHRRESGSPTTSGCAAPRPARTECGARRIRLRTDLCPSHLAPFLVGCLSCAIPQPWIDCDNPDGRTAPRVEQKRPLQGMGSIMNPAIGNDRIAGPVNFGYR